MTPSELKLVKKSHYRTQAITKHMQNRMHDRSTPAFATEAESKKGYLPESVRLRRERELRRRAKQGKYVQRWMLLQDMNR